MKGVKMYKISVLIISGVFIWVLLYYILGRAVPITTYVALNNQSNQSGIIDADKAVDKTTNNSNASQKILFVGDIMLDRGVAQHAEKYGKEKLFAGVKELFESVDAIVANLEGTITNNSSISAKDNSILRFTFKPSFAVNLLKDLKVTAVSQANNHSFDFGSDGFAQTKKNLDEAGIISFGSAKNDVNISNSIYLPDAKKVCLVGYHDLYTYNEKPALEEVNRLKKETLAGNNDCYLIILFAHWGNEYEQKPSERQKDLAHRFIDAGADIVVGAHPHVVQPFESYNGKAIFYSLGNFMFDQDFSYNTTHGLAVLLEISNSKLEHGRTSNDSKEEKLLRFELIPVSIIRSEVGIANIEDAKNILKIVTSDENKNSITLPGSKNNKNNAD